MATGRSDYPNQVNNVLGFPFIFRGALDVHGDRHQRRDEARRRACAGHAREGRRPGLGDQGVRRTNGSTSAASTSFPSRSIRASCSGKPPRSPRRPWKRASPGSRSKTWMPTATRSRAGSAGRSRSCGRSIHKAQQAPKRIVFPEGTEEKILRASQIILDEEIAKPILLGDGTVIQEKIKMLDLDLTGVEIIDPVNSTEVRRVRRASTTSMRKRKGITRNDARDLLRRPDQLRDDDGP